MSAAFRIRLKAWWQRFAAWTMTNPPNPLVRL